MGFFRRLFGAKKPAKDRRRWSFTGSSHPSSSTSHLDALSSTCNDTLDANKHAIAVATATAAVAEAALAAAHAAAEVVRLTSGGARAAGGSNRRLPQEVAAVKIQSAFRGYLARRALRALKALVKLQALVRGHIVRKQTADMLRRMQTLVRLQARARASRSYVTKSFDSSCKISHSRKAVHENSVKDECQHRACSTKFDGPSILKRCGSNSNLMDIINLEKARMGSNWLDNWMEESLRNNHRDVPLRHRHVDDEKSDKILEVDTWKPHLNSQRRKMKQFQGLPILTSDNSPQVLSASSSRPGSSARRSPFVRSECSWGYLSGYSGHPNYMANTESSRAKYRSQSAPRQRLEFDTYGSTRRTLQGLWDSGANSERDFAQHVDFSYRPHPTSGLSNKFASAHQGR
ncbi:hypothetical protein V6N13_056681 [Hibiscus sabdariffa]|uniref:DUF4005 domain-containing protein n=1 Tax=Hibiscus sabdariffa TaxID=183260 RepID=A0ABR2B1W3_9ROSI